MITLKNRKIPKTSSFALLLGFLLGIILTAILVWLNFKFPREQPSALSDPKIILLIILGSTSVAYGFITKNLLNGVLTFTAGISGAFLCYMLFILGILLLLVVKTVNGLWLNNKY